MKATKNKSLRDDEVYQFYIEQVNKISLLTFEEEQKLSRSAKNGNEAARCRLIEANLRLVIKIAFECLNKNVCLLDLIQEGNIGLMRAVEKFDPNKMIHFSTYAALWVRQFINRYLLEKWRIISLPGRKEIMLRKIHHASHALSQQNMRSPSMEEISAKIGVPKADVKMVLSHSHDVVSLEAAVDSEDSSGINETLEDYTYNPEVVLLKKNSEESFFRMLNILKAREKNLIIYRYLQGGKKRQTLSSVSVKMGISRESVRQIELTAIKKLRFHAEEFLYEVI